MGQNLRGSLPRSILVECHRRGGLRRAGEGTWGLRLTYDQRSPRPDAGTASKSIVLPRLRPAGYAGWRALAVWFRVVCALSFQRLLAERGGSQSKQLKSLSNMSVAFLAHEG